MVCLQDTRFRSEDGDDQYLRPEPSISGGSSSRKRNPRQTDLREIYSGESSRTGATSISCTRQSAALHCDAETPPGRRNGTFGSCSEASRWSRTENPQRSAIGRGRSGYARRLRYWGLQGGTCWGERVVADGGPGTYFRCIQDGFLPSSSQEHQSLLETLCRVYSTRRGSSLYPSVHSENRTRSQSIARTSSRASGR